jgi:hypothetical protein
MKATHTNIKISILESMVFLFLVGILSETQVFQKMQKDVCS